jgi:hypothetical protein
MDSGSLDHLSDQELLARYLGNGDQSGAAFLGIWNRYRRDLRDALEREGLSGEEAERLIGVVFDGLSGTSVTNELGGRLRALAREVARSAIGQR